MQPVSTRDNFEYICSNTFNRLLIFFLVAVINPSYAQDKNDSIHYRITSWSANDGIPSTIISLYQDKDEFLWIGSYDGLFRFDGTEFKSFNRFNSPGLTSHHITTFAADSNKNLWIGTGNGLVLYSSGKFTNLAGEFDLYVESLCIDQKNNKLWMGTRAGLFEYDIINNKYKKVERFSNDLVNAIVQDSSGGVWVGSEKKGLVYVKNSNSRYFGKQDGLLSTEVLSLFLDSKGILYVCTTSGLYRKQGEKFIAYKELDGLRAETVKVDPDGLLWVATTVGLYKQNRDNTWRHITKKNGISNSDIRDICFDKEGSIWLATYRGGLNQLRTTKFVTISARQGLFAEAIGAIVEMEKNKFFIGSTDGKLYKIENGRVEQVKVKAKLSQRICSILLDDRKNLWVASYDGLLLLTPDGRERLFTEKDGLPTQQVRLVYQDRKRNYWVGSRNKGLIKMEFTESSLTPRFEHYKYDELNRLNSTFIMSMEEDNAGNLLVATNIGGLLILSPDGTVQHYSSQEGFEGISLGARIDAAGIVWIASTEGLSIMENGKFFNIDQNDGLPTASVFDIVEDDRGYCWMATAKGIIRVKKQELLEYKNRKRSTIDWKFFGSNDELEISECTGATPLLKAMDGSLWFPMLGGLVVVNTNALSDNKRKPNIYIESATVDDEVYKDIEKLVIPAGDQRVVFNYTALSLHYPNSPRYKYRLKPFDKDWNDVGTDRQAVYTSLPGGTYTFNVIACNNDGVWNTAGASLIVVKKPYFYQTWWFYSLSFAMLIAGTLVYVRWRTKEVKMKAFILEQEVDKRTLQLKQKTEALEEQNREKTGMINIVAHDLKAPLNKIKGLMNLVTMKGTFSEDQREYFNYIDNSIQQGNSLIRDLLDIHFFEHEDSKLEINEIDIVKVLNEWERVVSGLLSQKNQRLQFQIDISNTMMLTDQNKLIRILDNLLTNASKFSEKEKPIYFHASENGNVFNFSIRDEGPGISDDDKKKLFKRFQKLSAKPTSGESSSGLGLSIIKVLVTKLGGNITVNSKLGEGTEFTVSLPNGRN